MTKSLGLMWILFGGVLGACTGGGDTSCIPAGMPIAVTRANAAGACPAAVVAGVTALNGSDNFTPMKDISCGVIHLTLTANFFAQDANHASCTGTDTMAFQTFATTGGTGTDSMAITCTDNTTCTETFDVTLAPM